MSGREKILGIAIGLLVAVLGFRALNSRLDRAASARRGVLRGLEKDVQVNKLKVAKGMAAEEHLKDWRARSLPHNPQDSGVAGTDYWAWMVDQLEESSLRGIDVKVTALTRSRRDQSYRTLSITAIANGSLGDLSDFLFRFYQAPFLHMIRALTMNPEEDGGRLALVIAVDALVLPGADQTDDLPKGEANRLAHDSAEEYREAIVGRNLFAVYKPPVIAAESPKTEQVSPTTPFDDATQANLSGIVEWGDQWEAWVDVRTTGKKVRLRKGDEFKIGLMEGRVERIQSRQIVIEADGKRLVVKLGKFLREVTTLSEDTGG